MALFWFNGGYVPVRDLSAAAEWYKRAFGCRSAESIDEEGQRVVTLKFTDDDPEMMLGPAATYPPNDLPPIVNTTKVSKANDYLRERGVLIGPIQQDSQGTKFFELRDCDGNILEISEVP